MDHAIYKTRSIVSTDPATGEILGKFECATEDQVRSAVEQARIAQIQWQSLPARERVRILTRFQRALYDKKEAISAQISAEAGKPQVEALLTEVIVVLDAVRFCVWEAPKLLRTQRVPHGNPAMKAKRGYVVREPYGVVGIISPWNYPFSIPATEVLAALITGNAVVLKPSELTPLTALRLRDLFDEAGLPEGLFQVVIGDGITGATLTASPIDKLIFTGSVATGKKIAGVAAERLLPIVLELGGKDPMIVLEDADLETASSAAVWGAFMNAGQTCLSVERCYVHRKIGPRFVQRCVEKAELLRIGKGTDPNTEIGPMINERQLRIVEEHIADAVLKGARVLTGGKRLPDLGANYFQPTVLVDVKPSMRIMREETFGPVLPIMQFDSTEEAIALANDSDFGLAASIWTKDRQLGNSLATRIRAGSVMVNDVITGFGISEAPHGGVKQSGLGRTHGRFGLEEMVRPKYIDIDLLPGMAKVWWYGYGAAFSQQMEGFADFLFSPSFTDRIAGGIKSIGAIFRKRS